jgi:transposase InsO family protein
VKAITDALDVSRSNQYEPKKGRKRYGTRTDDENYLPLVKEITDGRSTYGYRRVTAVMNRILMGKGEKRVNHKRVYRIMRIHHLLLQKYTGRPARAHTGDIITLASNMRWCSDIFEVLCFNAQRIRIAFAMDCCDREIMGYTATTGGITGDMVRDLMASSMEHRFGKADCLPHPIEWLSDNGSAYTANETISFARLMGFIPCTTPYYSPESNGMAESFVKTFKRDYVYMHDLPDAITVMEKLPLWFEDYNENHPHKGLKMLSPREYRRREAKLETCPV